MPATERPKLLVVADDLGLLKQLKGCRDEKVIVIIGKTERQPYTPESALPAEIIAHYAMAL